MRERGRRLAPRWHPSASVFACGTLRDCSMEDFFLAFFLFFVLRLSNYHCRLLMIRVTAQRVASSAQCTPPPPLTESRRPGSPPSPIPCQMVIRFLVVTAAGPHDLGGGGSLRCIATDVGGQVLERGASGQPATANMSVLSI